VAVAVLYERYAISLPLAYDYLIRFPVRSFHSKLLTTRSGLVLVASVICHLT